MKRKAHYWTSKLFFKSLHKKNCQSKNESLFQSFILSFKKSCMSTCSLVRHSLLLVRRTPISDNLYYTTLYWIKVKHWLDLVTNQTPDSQPLGHKHLSLSSTDFPEIPIFSSLLQSNTGTKNTDFIPVFYNRSPALIYTNPW